MPHRASKANRSAYSGVMADPDWESGVPWAAGVIGRDVALGEGVKVADAVGMSERVADGAGVGVAPSGRFVAVAVGTAGVWGGGCAGEQPAIKLTSKTRML